MGKTLASHAPARFLFRLCLLSLSTSLHPIFSHISTLLRMFHSRAPLPPYYFLVPSHNLIFLLQPTRIYNLHFSPPGSNGAREIRLEQLMQANSFELFKEKIILANYSFLRLVDDFLFSGMS